VERTFFGYVTLYIQRYGTWFLYGAGVTLMIALVGTVAGFVIGLMVSAVRTVPLEAHRGKGLRYHGLRLCNLLLVCYIEVFRGTPMMVQAIVLYYGFQEWMNIDFAPLTAGLIVISLNTGAYMAEIARGGIQAIDPGQTEAAKALGMTHWQTMGRIIFPQAIRNILPATGNEFIINIKDSSVLNVISVAELYFMTKTVRGVALRTFEVFLITAVIYLALTLTVTQILKRVEKYMDGPVNFSLSPFSSSRNKKRR